MVWFMPTAPEPVDIVILSNGPGEVATWVKPVAQALKKQALQKKANTLRISVLLSPCPHASGQEAATASSYPEIDRVQSANHFFKFLLTGKTADSWDWHPKGIVVFLGGDQFYTVLVAKRLGYRTATYAEWDARWPQWIDSFGVMQPELIEKMPQKHRHKFTVVGDLMADVQATADRASITDQIGCSVEDEMIGFLPGSKPAKLSMGVPLMLAIAQSLHTQRPQAQYVIGVAPNVTLPEIMRYADPARNPAISIIPCPKADLIEPDSALPYLQIQNGPKIHLWQTFPALDLFSQCALCLTTVGANTAQLGALAVPMLVLIPTQQIDGLRLLDGPPGLLVRIPGIDILARKYISPLVINAVKKSGRRFAWPNIWAKKEVVPELLGEITAEDVSAIAQNYLTHPEKLNHMRQTLQSLRGPAGAANKMASLILETVN